MYHVVEFANVEKNGLKSVDVVPTSWVKNRTCLWPPWKSSKLVQAAVIKCTTPNPTTWSPHEVIIMKTCGKFWQQIYRRYFSTYTESFFLLIQLTIRPPYITVRRQPHRQDLQQTARKMPLAATLRTRTCQTSQTYQSFPALGNAISAVFAYHALFTAVSE